MSEDTTAPATETKVAELPPPVKFSLYEESLPCELHTVRSRGKGVVKGATHKVVRLAIPSDSWDPIYALARIIGNGDTQVGENLLRSAIIEMVNERLDDAAEEAFNEEGRLNPTVLEVKFPEEFSPTSRKSGMKKKDIEERLREIGGELSRILSDILAANVQISEEMSNELGQFQLEHAKLTAALAKSSKKRGALAK